MKQLISLDSKSILHYVLKSTSLKDRMNESIQENEFNYIREQLSCFKNRCIDWQVSLCSYSYLDVLDESEFLDGVEDCIRCFGASTKLENLTKQTRSLQFTNLFSYYIEKLKNCFYDNVIGSVITYLENISSAIWNEDEENEELIDVVSLGDIDWMIDDVYVTSDGRLVREQEL